MRIKSAVAIAVTMGTSLLSGGVADARKPTKDALVATFPGFEMLDEGGSRVFVELTKTAQVEEKHGKNELIYRIHGARITQRNNTNPLVTVHFNTPVEKAQLVSSGKDVLLRVKLRVDATASWKVATDKDGGFVLQVDFAKGEFLPKPSTPPAGSAEAPAEAK